jgi:hypothetical protein
MSISWSELLMIVVSPIPKVKPARPDMPATILVSIKSEVLNINDLY